MKTYLEDIFLEELGIKLVPWCGEDLDKGTESDEVRVVFSFTSCCIKIVSCALS